MSFRGQMQEDMTVYGPDILTSKFSSNSRNASCLRGSFYKLNIVKSLHCATCSSEEVQRHKFPTQDKPRWVGKSDSYSLRRRKTSESLQRNRKWVNTLDSFEQKESHQSIYQKFLVTSSGISFSWSWPVLDQRSSACAQPCQILPEYFSPRILESTGLDP